MSNRTRDDWVTIEKRTVVQDPVFGTHDATWAAFAGMWAEVQDVLPSRSERIDESISIQRRPARMRVDYLDGQGVTSDMRVKVDGREGIYEIVSGPAEKGQRDQLEFIIELLSTQGDMP